MITSHKRRKRSIFYLTATPTMLTLCCKRSVFIMMTYTLYPLFTEALQNRTDDSITCSDASECNIDCLVSETCAGVSIQCPVDANCIIDCNFMSENDTSLNVCDNLIINATRSTSLSFQCHSQLHGCDEFLIRCPERIDSKCIINSTTHNSRIYAKNGFSDLQLSADSITNTTVFCGSNYHKSCLVAFTAADSYQCSACTPDALFTTTSTKKDENPTLDTDFFSGDVRTMLVWILGALTMVLTCFVCFYLLRSAIKKARKHLRSEDMVLIRMTTRELAKHRSETVEDIRSHLSSPAMSSKFHPNAIVASNSVSLDLEAEQEQKMDVELHYDHNEVPQVTPFQLAAGSGSREQDAPNVAPRVVSTMTTGTNLSSNTEGKDRADVNRMPSSVASEGDADAANTTIRMGYGAVVTDDGGMLHHHNHHQNYNQPVNAQNELLENQDGNNHSNEPSESSLTLKDQGPEIYSTPMDDEDDSEEQKLDGNTAKGALNVSNMTRGAPASDLADMVADLE